MRIRSTLVNRETVKDLKKTIPLASVTLFTLLLFFWIVPIPAFNVLQSESFESIVFSFWLIVVGLVFITLGILSLPEMKNTASRIGGFFLIAFGLISFLFSIIAITQGFDVLRGDDNLRFFTTILFGGGAIILLADLVPRLITGKGLIRTMATA